MKMKQKTTKKEKGFSSLPNVSARLCVATYFEQIRREKYANQFQLSTMRESVKGSKKFNFVQFNFLMIFKAVAVARRHKKKGSMCCAKDLRDSIKEL